MEAVRRRLKKEIPKQSACDWIPIVEGARE
jgi:hypothetical protein